MSHLGAFDVPPAQRWVTAESQNFPAVPQNKVPQLTHVLTFYARLAAASPLPYPSNHSPSMVDVA